jgi:serine/threonine-protein kinase
MQPCPACGASNQDAAKFCNACGHRLTPLLAPGDTLQGRYRITRLLGRGGMGAVYQAQDTRLGSRPVAVKENFDASAEAQAQFQLEAMTLAGLNHTNLPRVSDHFIEPSGKQYLVMDFVEGQDLQELLDQRGRLTEAQALPWIEQVCDALDYLHGQNPPIIHRDIKPANVKITPAGRAMLVDFGIAKQFRPGQQTMAAARAVTSGFSPPEQYGGARTDARSDVYALGATLYCLLTGQVPPDAMDRLTGDRLAPPRQLNSAVSAATEAAILQAMELNPPGRPQTVRLFREMLRARPTVFGAPALTSAAAASPAAVAVPRPAPPVVRPAPVSRSVASHDYASFGRRLAAALIDGVILMILGFVIGGLWAALFGSGEGATLWSSLAGVALYFGYFTHFYARSGQTPGKKAVGIQVIATDGSLLTGGKAFVRTLVYFLDSLMMYILIGFAGFLWMLWDKDRQTWHDKAAGSYVIRV